MSATATIARMGKPNKKKANRVGRAVTLWLRADLFAGLEEWRKRQPVAPTRTATIEKGLIQFLASHGIVVPEDED